MRLLLDSPIVFWWVGGAPALTRRQRNAIERADEAFVSAVTIYELGLKAHMGRLHVAPNFMDELGSALAGSGFSSLPVTAAHMRVAAALPLHHRDPFDRILASQCLTERLTLVTSDRVFRQYEVPLLGAK